MQAAHRVSYFIFNGLIPDGACVLHRCDNPACVNPKHLFLGTQQDNMADKKEKGRNRVGERHQNSRLSLADVIKIRVSAHRGYSQKEIATLFGISQSQVSHIVTGKQWRNQ